jgi:hypothetical protein
MPSDDALTYHELQTLADKKRCSVGELLEGFVQRDNRLSTETVQALRSQCDSGGTQTIEFDSQDDLEWHPDWLKPESDQFKSKKYKEWFRGMPPELQKGIGRAKPSDEEGKEEHDVPPAYYAESSPPVRIAKAFIMAFTTVAPYFAVFDQLSTVKPETWIPCSNHTCHYIRIFNSENLPGTGSNVIAVENGVERPVAMDYKKFEVFSCGLNKDPNKSRSYVQKLQFWNANGATCSDPCHECAHQGFNSTMTHEVVHAEQDSANKWTPSLRLSFFVNKLVFWSASVPMNLFSKFNKKWGMEHIPSGRCPKMSPAEMKATCDKIETKRNVVNHLENFSPSKYVVYGGLVGYAILQAVHDLILMKSTSNETLTLQVGAMATACLGLACAAVFLWAMGATEVFVAPVEGHPKENCMCFYQLPELTALIGLATPFALYAVFRAQVQMRGLACLYGDYLSWITFIVPHYLARQSFLWTWGTMVTPKSAGTVTTKGTQRPYLATATSKSWAQLQRIHSGLYTSSNLLGIVVAFTASSFMISFKEVCVSMYKSEGYTPLVQTVIKYVLLPLPTLATYGIGGYALNELYHTTLKLDPGESICGQLKVVMPSFISCCLPANVSYEQPLRYVLFTVLSIILIGFTVAAGHGLSPNLSFLLDFGGKKVPLDWTSLAQAELWSACGFVFFLIHMPRILAIAFSTWDDLESLKNLAEPNNRRPRHLSGDYKRVASN